ncbi:hypothetical protein ACROYT_G042404 [Oculina patagonica]
MQKSVTDAESKQKTTEAKTNWARCAICQKNKDESLRCPAETKRQSDVGAGYRTLAGNIIKFSDLDCMPVEIDLSRLDEGDGLESTFIKCKARWHKSCYDKFNCSKLKRAEKRRALEDEQPVGRKFTRANSTASLDSADTCFICDDQTSRKNPLHNASTLVLDERVRKCASTLQDEKLLAKLSTKDLVARDSKYHASCLALLYKKAATVREGEQEKDEENLRRPEGIALAELVSYIEESRVASDVELPVFKLAELADKYTSRLAQLGDDTSGPDLANALQKAHKEDCDEEAMLLAKAASIVRKDMLAKKYAFDGFFGSNCQLNSVPASLLSLVNMILYGPNIEMQVNPSSAQAGLTISQLLQYNSYHRRRDGEIKRERRNKSRETPISIYVGLSIHAKSRSRDLIETMHTLGLSVSYDRVLAISTDLGNAVCRQYQEEKVVCPPNLHSGLFTTSAVDNIDHNPSSTSARDSFHGTGISMFQHSTAEVPGNERARVNVSQTSEANTKSVAELPKSYTEVAPAVLPNKTPPVPATRNQLQGEDRIVNNAMKEELNWLENVNSITVNQPSLGENKNISWAAYHSTTDLHQNTTSSSAISALLPLFPDQAKSVAMIRHAMDVVKACVHHLNPGQTPVIAMDQPLYAVAKQIQWNWPDQFGEKKIVVMFGGLHIEMAFLKVLGGWLEDSGWVAALVDANVASPGTAESFVKATSVTRSRRAHQVTASCLFVLLKNAYEKYKEGLDDGHDALPFDNWCSQQASAVPQFQFWYTTLQLQLLFFVFLRSIRQSSFTLYSNALHKMLPWFFALNHTNYARWLPVHLRDLSELQQIAPDVFAQFVDRGLFTVHKSQRKFSAIAIDQAHEQNNAIVKGDGGAVGLTENPSALRRWMISGPEMARLVNEFEASVTSVTQAQEGKHHEAQRSYQVSFFKDVKSLVATIEDLGNPFLEESQDLIVLDTKEIAGSEAVTSLRQIEAIGREQFSTFVAERLVHGKKSLYDPIKRNKVSLFNSPPPKASSRATQQLSSVKSDCSLFARLYISCQTRDGDLEEFFKHENQGCPPSLSHLGKLRIPKKKSDLTECLQAITTPQSEMPPAIDVIIIDGAAAVNMIKPGTEKTFLGYAEQSFLPYIKAQLRHVKRIDVVWDEYVANSLKATTRSGRGTGVRRRVSANNQLPRKWNEFLRVDENKVELFKFLSECIASLQVEKEVISTYGKQILSTLPRTDNSSLAPCTQEEADTRMLLHVQDAVNQGHKKILLRTVDTDVLVLTIAVFQQLREKEQLQLWVAFGSGTHLRFIAAHEISRKLGPQVSKALPVFHAFIGCDTVSCFGGRGKKTALEAWKSYPDVTSAFLALAHCPTEISDRCIEHLERFVVLLYDRTSSKTAVNDARKQLFTQKGRTLDAIPPTRAALVEHTKRAAYQAGYCWGQALFPSPVLPSPQEWGWTLEEGIWKPFWTTLTDVTKSCRELVRCGCRKGCRARCSCVKAYLRCTALCSCAEECANT